MKTTPQTQKPATDESLHESAARGLEALGVLAAERDTFRQRAMKLDVDVALLSQNVEQLKRQVETLTAERDHYMKYASELVANLNNIQTIINDVVERATTAAFRRDLVPSPPRSKLEAVNAAALDQETLNLRQLIARLPKQEDTDSNA